MNSLLFNSIYNYLLLYLAIVPCIFALNLFFIIFPILLPNVATDRLVMPLPQGC